MSVITGYILIFSTSKRFLMSASPVKVLFLLPYPLNQAPSQRFRVEMLLPLLKAQGIQYVLRPFMTAETGNLLYKGGSSLQKATGVIKGYFRRLLTIIIEAPRYDLVFIHREAAPLGPPLFEWYLAKVLRKRMIYDFDDAIWIPNTSSENNLAKHFKAFWKVSHICRWSEVISAGNNYLCSYAADHTEAKVVIIPTVVDTVQRYNKFKEQKSGKTIVGWTGSHSTLKYLDRLLPVIRKLQDEEEFTFLVIADKKPEFELTDWQFVSWNAGTEIEDLIKIDIGLMPLPHDPWSEGKCGFKLIQYLALGIPALADPVGVNKDIIDHGSNGFLCLTDDEWYQGIKTLLQNVNMRRDMGLNGLQKIETEYSINSIQYRFLDLFERPL